VSDGWALGLSWLVFLAMLLALALTVLRRKR
jgi:hypothetical protein